MTEQIAASTISKAKKAICSICGGERNCDVFGDFDHRGSDDYMSWSTHWYLMKCRGCDHVFVQLVSTNSEDYDDHHNDDNGDLVSHHFETISYFPGQSKRARPDWLGLIRVEGKDADTLTDTLNELYLALDSDWTCNGFVPVT